MSNLSAANGGQGLTASGGGGRFSSAFNDQILGWVLLSLAWGYTIVFVTQSIIELKTGTPVTKMIVDGNMYKDVLLIVLGYIAGANGVKKGVEQGTFAALTPPPQPANSMTTTTTKTEPKP